VGESPEGGQLLTPSYWTLPKTQLLFPMICYEQFLTDWKDAGPDTPELIDAKKRMAVLGGGEKE